MGQRRVLVPIADGSEDLETATIFNVLKRGGNDVILSSVSGNKVVTCSRGLVVTANELIDDSCKQSWDLIVCPGGLPGAQNLAESEALSSLLKRQFNAGKYVAAICAAPAVTFARLGLLTNRRATCYPAPKFVTLLEQGGAKYSSADAVVTDGNVVTATGPSSSLKFALALVAQLNGLETARRVAEEMLH